MRKLMIALVMTAALLPLNAYTLGLGEIEVNSALNQELNAEIKLLSAAPEDAESLIVKLASREEFSRAGLDRPFLLQSLKFDHAVKDGVPYLTITSSKPIREPFLNFLLEVDWPKGHLLREYTILLDPPVFINEQAAVRPAVESRPGVTTGATSTQPNTGSSRPSAQSQPVPARVSSNSAPAPVRATSNAGAAVAAPAYRSPNRDSEYRIKPGDTAWSLADSLRPDQSVTIEQMMLALLRTNPESFIDGNVNGLKRGYILRVPEREQITSVSQNDAVAMVRQQNALWREYQQIAGSGKPVSANPANTSDKNTAATGSSASRLSIMSAGKGAGSGSAENTDKMSAAQLRSHLAQVEERLESERLEKESLQGEVNTLEQQVSKMKRLLSIEDQTLAGMQAGDEPASAADKNAAAAESDNEAPANADDEMKNSASEQEMTPADADNTADNTADNAADSETEAGADAQVFVDQNPDSETQEAHEPAVADTAPAQQLSADDLMNEPSNQPQGLIAQIFNSPLVLAVAGGALLLVMALVYLIIKRRRASQLDTGTGSGSGFADDELASVADMLDDNAVNQNVGDDDVESSMASAEADAEKFDSDATMVLPSSEDTVITQSAEPEEEARDDIVAEADVYLAYGIYQQAEELLQGAINENPENDAYRMKLAETYFAGKNTSGFAELAAEMHKRTKGTGSRWQKLVVMGKELMPEHDLFKGESAMSSVDLDDLVPTAEPTMDIDLGDDDAGADLDFSLDDDNALDLPDSSADDAALLDLESELESNTEDELEFDLSETDAAVPETEDEPEFSLDIEASELDIAAETETARSSGDDLDFDLDLSAEADSEDDDDSTSLSEEDVSEDDLEFDIDVSDELGTNDLDAGDLGTSTSALSDINEDAEIDLSELSDVDEVSTKLDLARAYLDMGDHEGTRSILEEVIADGNAEQKAEAEGILADIDG